MSQSIKLQTSAILHVPLSKYDKNFTFIVNGESFHTSQLVADLLSQKVSNYHLVDPTINEISINTKNRGNFGQFLKLQNFEENHFSKEESKFICEIMKQLETTKIELNENRNKLIIDNSVDLLITDESFQEIFPKQYEDEIAFISTNFSEILHNQREKLKALSISTIERIINHPNLQLETEDDLLKFINELYLKSKEYSILYSYVHFRNVEINTIEEFINIFNIDDLDHSTWFSITNRLKEEIKNTNTNDSKRYKSKYNQIMYKSDKDFEGIFHFLINNSIIKDEIKITASSVYSGILEQLIQPYYPNNQFATDDINNSWICIEFIKHKVIPTHYTLRSNEWSVSSSHPRSWILEGSLDSQNWEKLDTQTECSYLKGRNLVHTFPIQNNDQPFKYFRIYQTGKSWNNFKTNYKLCFNCIEIYGHISE